MYHTMQVVFWCATATCIDQLFRCGPPISANYHEGWLAVPIGLAISGLNYFLLSSALNKTRLFVQPDVFHAPAVVLAVDHDGQVLDPGLPAGGDSRVKKHRADLCLGENSLDLPNDVFALY